MIDFPAATSLSSEFIWDLSPLHKSSAVTFTFSPVCCCWWSGKRARRRSLTSLCRERDHAAAVWGRGQEFYVEKFLPSTSSFFFFFDTAILNLTELSTGD